MSSITTQSNLLVKIRRISSWINLISVAAANACLSGTGRDFTFMITIKARRGLTEAERCDSGEEENTITPALDLQVKDGHGGNILLRLLPDISALDLRPPGVSSLCGCQTLVLPFVCSVWSLAFFQVCMV